MSSSNRTCSSASTLSAVSLATLVLCYAVVGCSPRARTTPRSAIIAGAVSDGQPIRTVEEDRKLFFARDEGILRRALSLIADRTKQAGAGAHYKVGAGDEVEINVFDVPELNVTARVRESGFISLPLIGAVQAVGRNENEITTEIAERLKEFVRQPQVSVYVNNFASQKVAILGAVNKPGTYSLRKGTNSLVELVSEAGGLAPKAGNFISFVPVELSGVGNQNDAQSRASLGLNARSGDAAAKGLTTGEGLELYLDQVLGTSGSVPLEIPVRGGDMIIIPEAGRIMIEGEVLKVGSYELGQQLTLLGALAASGGITYGAKIDEVEVLRDFGGNEKVSLVLDLEKVARGEEKDVRLRNGDIVRVPSDTTRRMTQDTFESIGRVLNFGVGGNINVLP